MDNEKLLKERNEKLALWADFKPCKCNVCRQFLKEFETQPFYNYGNQKALDLPDFEKVDECIKWLLPKIEDLDGVWFYPTDGGYYWTVSVIGCPANSFEGDSLAEAIEQYVISEEDEKVELEVA